MSQIVNLTLEELTLGQLELQMVLSKVLKQNAKVTQVLFLHLLKANHIIQVNQAVIHVQFTQAVLHKSLEFAWGITQPKQHVFTLKEP